MEVSYTPTFVKQFKNLEQDLQEEILEKIELFKDRGNHKSLKTHKLKGRLSGRFSFSVNYKVRIIFSYLSKKEVVFLAIGDHNIYK